MFLVFLFYVLSYLVYVLSYLVYVLKFFSLKSVADGKFDVVIIEMLN